MKKLITITSLVLALGFSTYSFAQGNMDLYLNGTSGTTASDDIRGGEIETSTMSFYLSPIKVSTDKDTLSTVEESQDYENTLLVFGVRI